MENRIRNTINKFFENWDGFDLLKLFLLIVLGIVGVYEVLLWIPIAGVLFSGLSNQTFIDQMNPSTLSALNTKFATVLFFIGLYYSFLIFAVAIMFDLGNGLASKKQLQDIKSKFDSGIIFSQNTTTIIRDSNSRRSELSLFYRGVGIGLLGGVLGGMVTGSMFELIDYQNKITEQSNSFPTIQLVIFVLSFGALLYLILHIARLVEKMNSMNTNLKTNNAIYFSLFFAAIFIFLGGVYIVGFLLSTLKDISIGLGFLAIGVAGLAFWLSSKTDKTVRALANLNFAEKVAAIIGYTNSETRQRPNTPRPSAPTNVSGAVVTVGSSPPNTTSQENIAQNSSEQTITEENIEGIHLEQLRYDLEAVLYIREWASTTLKQDLRDHLEMYINRLPPSIKNDKIQTIIKIHEILNRISDDD
jgi:hypothetical protein